MYYYKAFGLKLASEFEIPQVVRIDECEADVNIKIADIPAEELGGKYFINEKNRMLMEEPDVGRFRVTNGNLIEVCAKDIASSEIPVFVMGGCMGTAMHQRGMFPMHGSCVTNGKQTILITGDSGAGKSTTASVFIARGWKLLTDDLAIIDDPEGKAMVQPSYPTQKLWDNSPEMENKQGLERHSLYTENEHEKFSVRVDDVFCHEPQPLTCVVRLAPWNGPTRVQEITGVSKVDQLMYNTYRPYLIMEEDKQRHFQRCVTLSLHVKMLLARRNMFAESRELLYNLITGENAMNESEEKPSMDANVKLQRKSGIITADMNGSAVTMDVKTGKYYDLGETGGVIWNMLNEEKTYGQLIDEIIAEYEVDRSECEADVESFLLKLIGDGMVIARK